jgi:hypothetical protein
MKELLSDLHIDSEAVARDRNICAGIGRAYEHAADEAGSDKWKYAIAAATNYRRAGAHSFLLDDPIAPKFFDQAAAQYRSVNPSYALLMATFSREAADIGRMAAAETEAASERVHVWPDSAYAILAMASTGPREGVSERNRRIRDELESVLNRSIGLLGIPVGTYLELSESLDTQAPSELVVGKALLPFITAYDSALRQAAKNRHHWRVLNMPFHPCEPDILAVLFLAETRLRRAKSSVIGIATQIPLFWATRNIIEQALASRFKEPQSQS